MKTVDFRKKVILSHFFLIVLFVCVLMSSWVIQAAGLGNLNVGSYLGQPFKAEIALVSVKKEEVASLSARLASPEAFQKAGINFSPYLSILSVSIEKRADGRPYLQISSSQAINEPFLNLLIELNWSSGRVLREYTVLLDPAETQKTTSTTPILQSGVDGDSLEDAPTAALQGSAAIQSEQRDDWIGETYGPVSQGDTLTRIARQVSPKDADLNQMLVALYRANRDAFIEKNMNLLRVGVILRIPDQSEISTIAPREAVREVRLQTENWNVYRRRVADAAASMPGGSESRQSLTGKISTVDEKPTPSGVSRAEEVLILSKGELLGSDQQATQRADNDSAQNYLRMMEEDAIAKERALEEANERVVMLEQNIAKLQRLLELKGSTAEAQTQIEQSPPRSELDPLPTSVQGTQTESTSATTVSPAQGAKDSTLPEFTIPAQSVVAESLVNPALQSEYLESDSPSLLATFVDLTMDNLELLGGALAALLVIWLSASIIRRKSEKADDFDEIEAYGYTAEQDAMASATDTRGAPEKENSDHMRAEFDLPAESSPDQSKFHNTKEANEDPAVAASGFFFGKKLDEGVSTNRQSDNNSETETFENESTDAFGEGAKLSHEIEFDTERVESDLNKPAEQLSSDAQQNDENIKWNFPDQDIELSIERYDTEEEDSAAEKNATFQGDNEIKFEQDFSKTSGDATGKSHSLDEISKFDSNFADIDLDLGEESKDASGIESSDEDNTGWQEVATKIDLAKAYLEMDDLEGAKEILEEVLREGDSEQQAAARSMLNEVN